MCNNRTIATGLAVLQSGGCHVCKPREPSAWHRCCFNYEPMKACCYNKWQFVEDEDFWFFALLAREIEVDSCRYG